MRGLPYGGTQDGEACLLNFQLVLEFLAQHAPGTEVYLVDVVLCAAFAVLRENESVRARERERERAREREREERKRERSANATGRERNFVLHSKNESLRTMQESSAAWRNPDVC